MFEYVCIYKVFSPLHIIWIHTHWLSRLMPSLCCKYKIESEKKYTRISFLFIWTLYILKNVYFMFKLKWIYIYFFFHYFIKHVWIIFILLKGPNLICYIFINLSQIWVSNSSYGEIVATSKIIQHFLLKPLIITKNHQWHFNICKQTILTFVVTW
jgi:hypothetical protein